ncbi:retrovirus-related pol polyprotein from transposon TNT 1-94 [Tanacetum coccineum]
MKLDEVIPFEKQSDNLKKRLAKSNEAKMVIYNALPRKEYNKISCVMQQKKFGKLYESIDSDFARFNTIITSLKALDEESKDLTSLSLDELIGNLKVHEMIIKKDSEIVKAKGERKSLALKAKKESSYEECSTSGKCPKPPKDKNQRVFVGGSWSDSGEEDDEKAKAKTCLVAQASNEICLGVDLEPDEWIKDSGCSKHMTGNQKLFSSYKAYNGGNVIFGSNLRSNIIGKGYSQNSKAYIILNKHTRKIEESFNVTFDETPPPSKTSPLVYDDLDKEEEIKEPLNQKNLRRHLLQFIANDVWEVSSTQELCPIIGKPKVLFRNTLKRHGIVSQNKARLVAQGYNQQEGIDYDETYSLVARLESIRLLLAYACGLDFKYSEWSKKCIPEPILSMQEGIRGTTFRIH